MTPVSNRRAGEITGADARAGLRADAVGGECSDIRPGTHRFQPMFLSNLLSRRSAGGARYLAAWVWLLFIVFPLANAIGKHGSGLDHGLLIGGAALFVVVYVTMVVTWRRDHHPALPALLFVALLCLAAALTLRQASGWGFLFTYCAACAAIAAPEGMGFYAVVLCSVVAGVTTSIAGANGGTVLGFVASSAGIGMLMLVMSDLRQRNDQLNQARAELARMAVAQERERFARDLHDLLGHSLSVIALKAELAGRMLTERHGEATAEGSEPAPNERQATAEGGLLGQAATEIRELEQVARNALSEVRDAVSGYRQPTLAGELAGARMALSAAGIEASIQEIRVPLDPAVEAVLAWTIREGATNVIRHSGARHCTVRLTASLSDAGVEVIDDGVGERGVAVSPNGSGAATPETDIPGATAPPARQNGTTGHGLPGLAERARLMNGTVQAGALAGGGYRLAVTIPVLPVPVAPA